MDCKNIKALLDKYWEGETSLEEEQVLRRYFNEEQVAKDLEAFRPLFLYLKQEKQQSSTQSFEQLVQPTNVRFLWLKTAIAAASIVLVLLLGGLVYQENNRPAHKLAAENSALAKDTYKDPEQAYQEAKAALLLISKGLNKGINKTTEGVNKVRK